MKRILGVVGALVMLFMLVAGITATPLVGEVVTLHTREGGEWKTTPLWVVDAAGGRVPPRGQPAQRLGGAVSQPSERTPRAAR